MVERGGADRDGEAVYLGFCDSGIDFIDFITIISSEKITSQIEKEGKVREGESFPSIVFFFTRFFN